MKVTNKGLLILILITATFLWLSFTATRGAYLFTDMRMNASLSQPICIQMSTYYSNGMFFTNKTTIGTQYAIDDVTVANNATGNYYDGNTKTMYNITACDANTINVTVFHCACDNLVCVSGSCAAGTDYMYVAYTAAGGVGWANSSNSTMNWNAPPDTTNFYFSGIDTYQSVAGKLNGSSSIHMRYWLNPRPDTLASGVYQANYSVRAVEFGASAGACSCV